MKSSKSFYFLLLIMIITACTPFGRLYKEQPRVTLALPAVRQTKPVEMAQNDSATTAPSLNFVPSVTKGIASCRYIRRMGQYQQGESDHHGTG